MTAPPVLRRVVRLANERRRHEHLWAVWRDAADCVRECHADLNAVPFADRDRRELAYDCLIGALRIEASAADRLWGALR